MNQSIQKDFLGAFLQCWHEKGKDGQEALSTFYPVWVSQLPYMSSMQIKDWPIIEANLDPSNQLAYPSN